MDIPSCSAIILPNDVSEWCRTQVARGDWLIGRSVWVQRSSTLVNCSLEEIVAFVRFPCAVAIWGEISDNHNVINVSLLNILVPKLKKKDWWWISNKIVRLKKRSRNRRRTLGKLLSSKYQTERKWICDVINYFIVSSDLWNIYINDYVSLYYRKTCVSGWSVSAHGNFPIPDCPASEIGHYPRGREKCTKTSSGSLWRCFCSTSFYNSGCSKKLMTTKYWRKRQLRVRRYKVLVLM